MNGYYYHRKQTENWNYKTPVDLDKQSGYYVELDRANVCYKRKGPVCDTLALTRVLRRLGMDDQLIVGIRDRDRPFFAGHDNWIDAIECIEQAALQFIRIHGLSEKHSPFRMKSVEFKSTNLDYAQATVILGKLKFNPVVQDILTAKAKEDKEVLYKEELIKTELMDINSSFGAVLDAQIRSCFKNGTVVEQDLTYVADIERLFNKCPMLKILNNSYYYGNPPPAERDTINQYITENLK